jgi:threonine 3-dehydrogenase
MANGSRTRSIHATRARRNVPATRTSKHARTARTNPKGAATTGKPRVPMPRVAEPMWALVYDVDKDRWDKSRGFRKVRVAKPKLNPKDPLDASCVILKVKYTGFCGSDAGIWFRTSFKSMIHDSLKAEKKTTRVIGHEVLGTVAEQGPVVSAHYGYKEGDLMAAESHIVCGRCHQCLIGQRHVCVNERIIGISQDGGFAEYIKLPAAVLWRTDPDKIRPEVAVVQEPFGNAAPSDSSPS